MLSKLSQDQLFQKTEADLASMSVELRSKGLSRRFPKTYEIFWAMDPTVKGELFAILDAKQQVALNKVMLRVRFRDSTSVFFDQSVQRVAKLSKDSLDDRFLASVKSVQSQRIARMEAARLVHSRNVIEAIPETSRERFYAWIGTKLGHENDHLIQPFGAADLAKGKINDVSDLLLSPDLQRKFGITKKQIALLEEVDSEFSSSLSDAMSFAGFSKQPPGTKPGEVHERLLEKLDHDVRQVLTESQIITFRQFQNLQIFRLDFRVPFRVAEVVTFLGLNEDQQQQLLNVATREAAQYWSEIGKIDKSAFDELCRKLPEEPRGLLQKYFAGVWEIPVNPLVAWEPNWPVD